MLNQNTNIKCSPIVQYLSRARVGGAAFGLMAIGIVSFSGVTLADDAAPPGLAGDSANRIHDAAFNNETIEITLAPGEQMEYVLDVEQGNSLIYSWNVDKGNLYSDFHGQPEQKDEYPENYWIRYEESEHGGTHGTLVAPFSGHTAWYWVNRNDHPVTVHLQLVGYFSGNKIAFRKLPE